MKMIIAASMLVAGCYSSEENLGFSAVGEPRWAVSLGGRANDRGTSVAIDSLGDVVAGGEFFGPADFGNGLETVGGPWSFVTKRVASDGSERWTLKLLGAGSTSNSWVGDVAIGPQDTVSVVGSYMGTVDFGGQALTLPPDKSSAFIATYSTNGQLRWVKSLNDNAQARSVAVDANGRVFVTGVFSNSTLNFNGQLFREVDGDLDTFLVAFDDQGTLVWGTAFQASVVGSVGGVGPVGSGIAIAANGDVLTTGSFSAPTSFGGAVIDPAARVRTFLTRFRNDGLYLASRAVGPVYPVTSHAPDVAVNDAGDIVIQHTEVDESGAATGPSAAGLATLRVLDDGGNELWSSQVPNYGSDAPQTRTVATTPGGLILSSAWTERPFNSNDPPSVPGSMEVVAYAASGAPRTSTFGSRLGGVLAATMVRGTAVGSSGAVAFTGAFGGTVDFGTGALSARGQNDQDIYIVVVDPPLLAAPR